MVLSPRFLPFADAATAELPLGRLLRLSLFQVTVGMAVVLLIGTLNRVMIVELGVPAWLVSVMVALPLVFAPLRAMVGYRSDTYKSVLGWRRVPYLWFGTLLQFGGFAIMPFALLVLSGDTHGPLIVGQLGASLAFLLVGAGLHTTQTVGLALATDLAPKDAHPKVVALLCVMLMVGMVVSALVFGALLANFTEVKLIQVIQGAALVTMLINLFALWKQEPRRPRETAPDRKVPTFRESWRIFAQEDRAIRRLVALGVGTFGFSMQDILLEPYGGQVLRLTVGQTTALTAMLAVGGCIGFGLAAKWLGRGIDAYRVAGFGALNGLVAFTCVFLSAPLGSTILFVVGVAMIGFGGGLFAHATLTAAMATADKSHIGLALGVWGAVQATAAGLAMASGGIIRDVVSSLASHGALGPVLTDSSVGYGMVYLIEIVLLVTTLAAVGPLVGRSGREPAPGSDTFAYSVATGRKA
ncbi:BCD family MFS transporter [Hyphomicrobiales bacterium BP6-180914]|uniref:BCD family MFS transporter n=2 Tax=Lichenifustis flavocetrariae TaxID=2949735 RepID=A0AA42CLE9_9HYPH|nr:BCD family MFS transporter [Lichenifustis flavocetrariae]MCW6507307.1 BCD family MFS transporter [Lichenifustis flavocetrariae]